MLVYIFNVSGVGILSTVVIHKAAPGVLGTTTGAVLAMPALDLPIWVAVATVTVSVVFGVLVNLKGAQEAGESFWSVAAKVGALWILAFALGVKFAHDAAMLSVIALCVGLAGKGALDVAARIGVMLTDALRRLLNMPNSDKGE